MQNKIKHLEFIQTIIDRLARNSFLLKGWSMTIIAALFAFSGNKDLIKHILAAYFLIAIFWFKDSYYLWQERLFRALYNHTRKLEERDIDFSLEVKQFSKEKGCTWVDSIFSKTLLLFYFPLMLVTLIIFYFLR